MATIKFLENYHRVISQEGLIILFIILFWYDYSSLINIFVFVDADYTDNTIRNFVLIIKVVT